MRPQPFVDLLKGWLEASAHPGVAGVRTCAEVGWHEQPVGVLVSLSDGWGWLLQVVRGSPPGGDTDDPADFQWDRDVYRAARSVFEREQAAARSGGRGRPQATSGALIGLVQTAIGRAAHEGVAGVEVTGRDTLTIACTDGSALYGLPVGWVVPGAASLTRL